MCHYFQQFYAGINNFFALRGVRADIFNIFILEYITLSLYLDREYANTFDSSALLC